jgi:hypothetical protein
MAGAAEIRQENVRLGPRGYTLAGVAGVVGAGCLAAAAAWALRAGGREWEHFLASYLANYCYFLSLALGGLFLVLLERLVHASWSVVLRRLAEGMAASLPWLGLLLLPILWDAAYLYPWANPSSNLSEHLQELLRWKRAYLNIPFFWVRALIYFSVWLGIAYGYLALSSRQDRTGEVALTRRLEKLAPAAMIAFALTLTFASLDWIMSRDPYWYSTIYGVYYFSGCAIGAFALLSVVTVLMQFSGRLIHAVRADHYQDLGKYTFGFIVFWGYIAFSQYMLIWYGNIPEETEWYHRRSGGDWGNVSLLLVIGQFFVPFFALISRWPKRHRWFLGAACVWILAMHWFDVYWLVMPEFSHPRVPLGWLDLVNFVGIAGVCTAGALTWLAGRPLVPLRDPRLRESLLFENA